MSETQFQMWGWKGDAMQFLWNCLVSKDKCRDKWCVHVSYFYFLNSNFEHRTKKVTENSVIFAYDSADIWKLLVLKMTDLFESYIKYL